MPSRVADNNFWLGRYVERAENIARMARTMISRVPRADKAELGCLVRLHSCLESRYSKLPKAKRAEPSAAGLQQELISLISDPKRPDSLVSTLAEVSRVGGNVRERLSADMTFLLGKLRDTVQFEPGTQLLEYTAILTNGLELLSAFSGMERENILRGSGWLFMSLGRRLERAIFLARQLREVTIPLAEEDWPLLECLLEVADSSMTYRGRYYTTLQPLALLEVLMMDDKNPRSLDFQLSHLEDLYEKLPRHAPEDLETMQEALELLREVDLRKISYPLPGASVESMTTSGTAGLLRLERFLRELELLLPSWSNNLSSRYFSHARTLPVTIGQ